MKLQQPGQGLNRTTIEGSTILDIIPQGLGVLHFNCQYHSLGFLIILADLVFFGSCL